MALGRWLTRRPGGESGAPPRPVGADLEVVLGWALREASGERRPRYPLEYVGLLREFLEPRRLEVVEVRSSSGGASDEPARRFAALVGCLAELPPLDFALAERIARVVDGIRGDLSPLTSGSWTGPIDAHFGMSSSFGLKGRVLVAAVRAMRPAECLELGTAYGMSATFLLEAPRGDGPATRVTTVECDPGLSERASRRLGAAYGDRVRCVAGTAAAVLPDLVRRGDPIDLLFHDAGHSREHYTRDFRAVEPALADGAIVLIDDIRWHDPRFCDSDPRCHEGWIEVASHPRVRRAVEVGGDLGMLLLGERSRTDSRLPGKSA